MRGNLPFNGQQLTIHLVIWALVILFPYLFVPGISHELATQHYWYPVIQYAIIFYTNYFVLTDKLLFTKKYFLYGLSNLLLVALFRFDWLIFQFPAHKETYHADDHGIDHHTRPLYWLQDILVLFIPAVLSIVIRNIQKRSQIDAGKKELENKHLLAEIAHLKYQLQPHFFFNALNNIYSLIEINPTQAQDAVHKLGKLMRYLLYDTNREKVALAEEINFMEKYIQLMELRHNPEVVITYHFPKKPEAKYEVAPLLFIPLIENAFKHGISSAGISNLSFTLFVQDNMLTFLTANHNYPKNEHDKSGSGIGIDNLQKRLALIYPGKHHFNYGVTGNRFLVTLQISFEE